MTGHEHHHGHGAPSSILEVAFKNCHDGSEFADLERDLAQMQGVTSVHLDRTRGVAHLGYDPGVVTRQELQRRLHTAGYACDCEDCPPSSFQPGHPRVSHEHQGHAVLAHGASAARGAP